MSRLPHSAGYPRRRRWPCLAAMAAALLILTACGRTVTYSQPEPGFRRHGADEVVHALREAGLAVEAVAPRPIATATPNLDLPRRPRVAGGPPTEPMVEVEARTFVIADGGGAEGWLFVFDSGERLRAKRIWFARFPDLYPYVYVHKNVLLWLDRRAPAAVAARYAAALEALP